MINMKKLPINMALFKTAFNRDTTFHDQHPINSYLDRVTGDLLFVYENDDKAAMEGIPREANKLKRERVASDHERYLLIPGRSHGDHDDFLKEFLASPWSDNQVEMNAAQSAHSQSIGDWMETVDNQNAINKYFEFRDKKLIELGTVFLREHRIDSIWKLNRLGVPDHTEA
jgi:hypothetical protein